MVYFENESRGPFTNALTLDDLVGLYTLNDFGKAPAKVWLPERELAQNTSSKEGSFLTRLGKGIINHLPIYSSLKTNDNAVKAAMSSVKRNSIDNHISGRDVWGTMYNSGINNSRTKKAFLNKLSEENYTIDGAVKSAHEIEHVSGLLGKFQRGLNNALDATGLDNVVGHLEIYKGKDGWDTFWRNTRIGGETQALISAVAMAGLGASYIYAAGAAAGGLREATGSDIVSDLYGYGTSLGFLGLAAYSGNLAGMARSGAMLAQQYFSKDSKGNRSKTSGKVAGILGIALPLSLLGVSCTGIAHANDDDYNGPEVPPITGDGSPDTEIPPTSVYTAPHTPTTPEAHATPSPPQIHTEPSTYVTPEIDVSGFKMIPVTDYRGATPEIHLAGSDLVTGESHIVTSESHIASGETPLPEVPPVPAISGFTVLAHTVYKDTGWENLFHTLGRYDLNGDSRLSPEEIAHMPSALRATHSFLLNEGDADRSGFIEAGEARRYASYMDSLSSHRGITHHPTPAHPAPSAPAATPTEYSNLIDVISAPFISAGSAIYHGGEDAFRSAYSSIADIFGLGDHKAQEAPAKVMPSAATAPSAISVAPAETFFFDSLGNWMSSKFSWLNPFGNEQAATSYAANKVSPFTEYANSHPAEKNEPLWKLLAKADLMDGNADGKASFENFHDVLAGQKIDPHRYDALTYFADNKVGGVNIEGASADGNINLAEAQAFLGNYHNNHFHNFADIQRKNIDCGKLTIDGNNNFVFRFTDPEYTAYHIASHDNIHDTKHNVYRPLGFTPQDSDVVVRIFRHNDGTPIAIADIDDNGVSGNLQFRDGINLSGQKIFDGAGHLRNGYFAEATVIDRNGWADNGSLHSYCPDQYRNDEVFIFDRMGGGHGHVPTARVPHNPEPWQVICRPSGPDPDNPMKPFTPIDDIPGNARNMSIKYETNGGLFGLGGVYNPAAFANHNNTLYVTEGETVRVVVPPGEGQITDVYESDGVTPTQGRESFWNFARPHHREVYVEGKKFGGLRMENGHAHHNSPEDIQLRGDQGVKFDYHPHHPRYRSDSSQPGHWYQRHVEAEPGNSDVNEHVLRTRRYHGAENVGEAVQNVEVEANPNKYRAEGFVAGLPVGYGLHELLAPARAGTDAVKTIFIDKGIGGQNGGPGIVGGQ